MRKLLLIALSLFVISILIFYVYSIKSGTNVNIKYPKCYGTTKGFICVYGGEDKE